MVASNGEDEVCVHILVSQTTQAQIGFANLVCETLATRYGLNHVVVRSANVPVDQLIQSSVQTPFLYAVLGPSTSTTSLLESESSIPIITIPTSTTTASVVDPKEAALSIAKCCSLASASVRRKVDQAVKARQQGRVVMDIQWKTESYLYRNSIHKCFDEKSQITGDGISIAPKRQRGKVRDRYDGIQSSTIALVTTDRQSGFDRLLAQVPFKGAVLNLTSAYWFKATAHIIPNHCLSFPHPNVTIAKKCKPFPIEFVVRSYMTGSTSTSIWKNYQNGVRNYCGHVLPEGMIKNQKLEQNILTPTTKEEDHDRPISVADIVAEKWMTQQDLDVCVEAAMKVFAFGQEVAASRGLILVDTKYEFGRDEETGEILLIDEVHTPDSSRYWLASTYADRMAQGNEPENIDKEFLRLWFRDSCDPYNDPVLPEAPKDLVVELSRRYIMLYELISGQSFDFRSMTGDDGIQKALEEHLK
ncbi:hypothetical protein ACA910_016683 [Epithemia clementina (nom. ined.)]